MVAWLLSLPAAAVLAALRDREGLTAVDRALVQGHPAAAEAILAASARPGPARPPPTSPLVQSDPAAAAGLVGTRDRVRSRDRARLPGP